MVKKERLVMLAVFLLSITFCLSVGNDIEADNNMTISPNPFKVETTITVISGETINGTINILDLNDVQLVSIYDGKIDQGVNYFEWDGTNSEGIRLPNGRYYIQYIGGTRYTSIKKIIILK